MFDAAELTIAFIAKRPKSAARSLAAMDSAEAATFLQEIPTRYAVQVVANMKALRASAILQQMGVTEGAAIVRELGFADATLILRQIDPAARGQYLELLPHALRRDFELSLAFPTGTVGAHMTMSITTLSKGDKTGSALDLIRHADSGETDVVFVIDEDRKLLGAVSATSLLQSQAHTPLAQLLDTSCVALSAHERLEAVAELEAWHDYNLLPVITRRGEVFGALSRRALRLSKHEIQQNLDPGAPSLAGSMVDAWAISATGLIELLLGSYAGSSREEHSRES